MSDLSPDLPEPKRSQRISLIWLIPLVAAGSAIWLGVKTIYAHGPTIEITFDTAEGLEAGHTKIKRKNVDLGTVERIELSKDLSHVVVTAEMTKEAEEMLHSGSRFWVVRPRVTLGQVSGLSTLLSGAYIELSPGSGNEADKFQGLSAPPVFEADVPGKHFTLQAEKLNSVTQGSPIYFHGVQVGEVLGSELKDATHEVDIYVFVRAPHDTLVHPQTRFWNASGFALVANTQGVRLATESLQSLLMGGISFDTPEDAAPQPAQQNAVFKLYSDESTAQDAIDGAHYDYVVEFPGTVKDLNTNAAVLLQGIPIGHVKDVRPIISPDGRIRIPVTLQIDVQRLFSPENAAKVVPNRQALDQLMRNMVARGLRARLGSASLLTGSKIVLLDFNPSAAPATLDMTGPLPKFPVMPGADLDSIMVSAQKLLDQLGALPLSGMVQDIRRTIRSAGDVMASPELKRSLKSLDTTLANLADTTQQAKQELQPTLRSLRNAASNFDATIAGAKGQPGLGDLMAQLTGAARSLRLLADYLDRHPEALIQGKAARP